jgi:YggT family protein
VDLGSILLTTSNLFFWIMSLLILVRVILSFLPQYRYSQIGELVYGLTDPVMRPIQNVIPPIGMIDISPFIAIILLQVLQALVNAIIASIFPV